MSTYDSHRQSEPTKRNLDERIALLSLMQGEVTNNKFDADVAFGVVHDSVPAYAVDHGADEFNTYGMISGWFCEWFSTFDLALNWYRDNETKMQTGAYLVVSIGDLHDVSVIIDAVKGGAE